MFNEKKIQGLLDSIVNTEIRGAVLAASFGDEMFLGAAGNLNTNSQFFIASATKLYITALVLQLVDKNILKLSDKIEKFLSPDTLLGLHIFDGNDYSNKITVEHLLSHTSGLADYFQSIRKSKRSLMDEILNETDQAWDFNRVIADSKELGSVFAHSSGKAFYSDTNFQILGEIIKIVLGDSLENAIDKNICQKMGLVKTYLYRDEHDSTPVSLNYKKKALIIPKAMVSFGADGGIVSTAPEGIKFLKGFFEGQLFDKSHLAYISHTWRNIFYPLKYGIGISLFRLPWYFSPFKRVPDLIGHSGLSGAFLFYCPERNIYLSGTVNQISKPQSSFKLMIKTILSVSE